MKPITILFIVLSLASLACLQTTLTASAPSATSTPRPAESAYGAEPESGAVFELTTPETAMQTCATVTAEKALHLRQAPDEKSRVITWLQAGTNVLVIGKVGAWWKVESAVGTGYARAKYLQESECR